MKRLSLVSDRSTEVLGLVGFVSLTVALLIAHANPATEYELSIYASTPITVWIGIGIAFVAAAIISFSTRNDLYRQFGILLGGVTSFSVVALPIIRGYFFHGVNDAMTHVGVTRELVSGSMIPYDTVYPGVHTVAAFISGFTSFSVWQSALLVPVIAVALFYIFTPLVVRAIVGGKVAMTAGAFSAFLLIPLHQLAASTHIHPSSQAVLFASVPLYLLIGYLRSPDPERSSWSYTAHSAIVLIAVVASILYHPMQALNVIMVLVAVGLVHFVVKRRSNADSWWNHRALTPVIVVSVIAYVVWIVLSPGILGTIIGTMNSIIALIAGTSPGPGSAIESQSASLQAIGSSPLEIYIKLFTVSTLYIIAAGTVLGSLLMGLPREADDLVDTRRIALYLGTGILAMLPIFLVYLFGNVGQYYFRQASFMMFVVTILGAIAVTYGIVALAETRFRTAIRPSVVTVFVVLFLLSSLVIFNSPYIHRANKHVTDSRVSGYQSAFEMTDDSAEISGVIQEPQRYHDAIVSLEEDRHLRRTINSSEMRQLQDRPISNWYLILSQNTYEREIIAYREHRFTRQDFETLERQRGVSQIFENGDTELYYVQ